MSITAQQYKAYRQLFTEELARQLGTTPDAIPTSVTKQQAADFLCLKNVMTLNVWHSNKRHGIAMLKVGRQTRPLTSWLIDMKLSGVSIAQEAA